jgi:hypothetical protein
VAEKTFRKIIDRLKFIAVQAGSGDGDYMPEDCDYRKKVKPRQKGGLRNQFS